MYEEEHSLLLTVPPIIVVPVEGAAVAGWPAHQSSGLSEKRTKCSGSRCSTFWSFMDEAWNVNELINQSINHKNTKSWWNHLFDTPMLKNLYQYVIISYPGGLEADHSELLSPTHRPITGSQISLLLKWWLLPVKAFIFAFEKALLLPGLATDRRFRLVRLRRLMQTTLALRKRASDILTLTL